MREKRLVIANRGEIARRVLGSARERGYTVAVISTPSDADHLVRTEADEVLEVPSFLDAPAIVAAARKWGAGFLHPGYGFLSENAGFATRVEKAGIVFVGPSAGTMKRLGNKESAKRLAEENDVPTLPSLSSREIGGLSPARLEARLSKRGLAAPFLVKAAGGGGGRGMRVVRDAASLPAALRRASEEAAAGFADPAVFVERFLDSPRHVEIQIVGDGEGSGVALGERECSMQRRYQKVVEEAPSPVVDADLRRAMSAAALRLIGAARYRGAGTVEFLLDDAGSFYFLEVNTRLQVEHPVTEMVYDVDLVAAQLELAEGAWPAELPPLASRAAPASPLEPKRWAIEARVLAEDPRADFLPTPGRVHRYREPKGPGIRVDAGVSEGGRVHPAFDSLIAKVIACGDTRAEAVERLSRALEEMIVHGATTNLPFLQAVVRHPDFRGGRYDTGWIPRRLEELDASLIPARLQERLASRGFREQLSFALAGGGRAESRFAARFRSVGNARARVGSERERGPVEIRCDPVTGETVLEGAGLSESLSSPASTGSRFSRALVAAFDRARREPGRLQVRAVATDLGDGELALTLFGETLRLEDPRASQRDFRASAGAPTEGEVRAPMAGKLLEVHVQEGDEIEEGQLVAVVESMKMQLEIGAPFGGRVERVLVATGDVLEGPGVVAVIASAAAGAESGDQLASPPRETSPARRRK